MIGKIKILFASLNFLLILTIINCQASQCTIKDTNISGECKTIRNCPSVLRKLKDGQRDYTPCSESNKIVVCCPLPYKPPEIATSQPAILRLHEKKCHEYQKYVYEIINYITPLMEKIEEKINRCGFKNTGLISGGDDAEPKEFPHMAALGWRINNELYFRCSGSLISERFILTAAHCMTQTKPHIVRLGDLNLKLEEDIANPIDISVQQVYIHPNYNSDDKFNDIALIKLAHDVTFDEFKRPACLPSESDWNNINGIISGWGNNDTYGISGTDHLQKATVQKFTQNECQEILNSSKNRFHRTNQVLYTIQVCAGSKTDNNDTCEGDSGGPLQVLNSREYCMWDIIGITSYGPAGCGNKGVPGIYTRVFPYIDWIENIVWNN